MMQFLQTFWNQIGRLGDRQSENVALAVIYCLFLSFAVTSLVFLAVML